ncbi:MAG TPA: hypothetical protein VJY41_05425 [Prolixibacteraceae bacterium]|nr:hypothetical protein [Prolixibacteraceae bacterium]
MANLFIQKKSNTLLWLNFGSTIVTALCVVFAVFMFKTKAMVDGVGHGKYVFFLVAVIFLSGLFLFSLATFIYFLIVKNKHNEPEQDKWSK